MNFHYFLSNSFVVGPHLIQSEMIIGSVQGWGMKKKKLQMHKTKRNEKKIGFVLLHQTFTIRIKQNVIMPR